MFEWPAESELLSEKETNLGTYAGRILGKCFWVAADYTAEKKTLRNEKKSNSRGGG